MKQNPKEIIDNIKHQINFLSHEITKLEVLLKDKPISNKKGITAIRELDSMKMVEEILKHPEASRQTLRFVKGIKDFKNETNFLSESQRFHLETTYHNLFGG